MAWILRPHTRKQLAVRLLTVSMILFGLLSTLYALSDDTEENTNPNLVRNGSLENTRNTWVNANCNYMSLFAGSHVIPGWTVSAATINEIVWGKSPTCDGVSAARGTYFVDLTGFGGDSSNGAIQQTLSGLGPGDTYRYSMDSVISGIPPLVTIGTSTVNLVAGKPFVVGSTTWTPMSGLFVANVSNPLLTIQNQETGQDINFIDNIAVRLH
jgi:hypothetical protein